MFEFSISGIPLAAYVVDKSFKITAEPVDSGESFTCYDGTVIGGDGRKTVTVNVQLERVPFGIAKSVSELTSKAEFNVAFNYPYETNEAFTCESYKATGRSKGQLWDVTLTLKSVAVLGGDGL